MNSLKENEWITINRVLLEIYDIDKLETFTERILKILRMLIPYSKGYFMIFNDDMSICKEKSTYIEMNKDIFDSYIELYYEKDYMSYVFDLSSHSMPYRDTDLITDELRTKTEFYLGYLKPNDIPYGAGILLRRNGKNIGVINFFRSNMLGDFSDKDMYILDVLKEHLSHILWRLSQSILKESPICNKIIDATEKFSLSDREKETLVYILDGMSNLEISEKMVISLSTVKKHVYNIFSKVNVKNRIELRAVIDKI